MPNYRRNHVPGGTYFFTVNLVDRRSDLLVKHIDLLKTSFDNVKQSHPFKIPAICVLPDHLHCLWALPENDQDFSTRWNLIKGSFSRGIGKGELVSQSRVKRRERGIWQRRFWEHTIRDEDDYENHFHYIHYNPLKHGLVTDLKDWPHSTYHEYVKQRVYFENWQQHFEPITSIGHE